MERGLEFSEMWVKPQLEFLKYWTETTRKFQESLLTPTGFQSGMPFKEMADICNSWGNTLENLSKIMTDGAVKIQETWKDTIEKLIEMNYELLKTFAPTGEKGEKTERVLKSVKSESA
jgi:hypothetical protein